MLEWEKEHVNKQTQNRQITKSRKHRKDDSSLEFALEWYRSDLLPM